MSRFVFSDSRFKILFLSNIKSPATGTFKYINDVFAVTIEKTSILPGKHIIATESNGFAGFYKTIPMVNTWFSAWEKTNRLLSSWWTENLRANQIVSNSLRLSGANYYTTVLESFLTAITANVI